MTNFQTSIADKPEIGLEGHIYTNNNNKFAISGVVETDTIKAGRFVKLGTDANSQIKNISATGDVALGKLVGVALADDSRADGFLDVSDLENQPTALDFEDGESVAVLKSGSVIMVPETAMTSASTVYIRHAGKEQVQTIVFSADLIADNVINGKVNGTSISAITYGTSNAATLTAIAGAIANADSDVKSAVSDGTHTITVTTVMDAEDVVLSNFAVTAGVSQATVAITETVASINTSNIGRIRNDVDGGTATISPTGSCRVLNSCAANGKAILNLSIN